MKYFVLIIWVVLLNFNSFANVKGSNENLLKLQQAFENKTTAQKSADQWNAQSIERSIALYYDASKNFKELSKFEDSADCLREIASLYIMVGKNQEAIELLNQTRQFAAKYSKSEKTAKTFSLLIISSLRLGKIEESKKLADNLMNFSSKTNIPEVLATALYSKGLVNYDDGKFKQATENYEQAEKLWQSAGNLNGQTKTLLELAYAYMTEDNFSSGLAKAEESLKYSTEIGNLQYQVLAQIAIGVLKSKLGLKQESVNIFLETEKKFPDGVNLLDRGILYSHLSEIYYDFNELTLAQNYQLKALKIYQDEKNIFAQLATLSKLGIVTFRLGDENKGLDYFTTAFKLTSEVKSDYYFSVLNQDLGNLYFKTNPEKALKYYNLALINFRKIKNKQHLVIIENNIGEIYRQNGKPEIARHFFDSTLILSGEIHNKFAQSESLYNLTKLDLLENNTDQALINIKNSLFLTESLTSDVDNSNLKSAYFSSIFDRYELYINLLMQDYNQAPGRTYDFQALQAAEKSRARSMLENLSLSEANLTKDADAETLRREKEIRVSLNAKADKLTDLLSGNAEKSETDKLDGEINELSNELEDIKAKLKQNSPIYSAIKNPAPFDVGEFQRDVLDENSLLLEFSFGKDESYLWLVGKTQVNSYILPPRERIETHIEKLRELIASREMRVDEAIEDYQKRIAAAEVDYQTEARELSGQLFGQIADKLSGKRLIIVPDGKLHYFPVAALPLPNSASNEPILLTNETIYEPSAQTLLLLEKSRRESSAAKNLLVFSDPVFTDSDARLSPENKPAENAETASADKFRYVESLNSLARLTASKDESDSITNIVGASASDVYSGFAANRDQLLNIKTEDYKILHFATHGLTNEQRPELSGIILSRFDEKGQKIDESFRIHDIYGLNLNADLVVLSACETGLGKEVKGEGLMSLNNAFLQTGAKTVMASLWKVEDGATLNLMKNFYNEMTNENLTPSQALRQAQIKLRQNPQYQSPFYWAAFTVQGDFKTAPKISRSSVKPLYFLTIAPLILFGFYLLRKIFWEINYLCKYGRKHSL